MKTEMELQAAKADIHEKIAGAATNHDLTHLELASILNSMQAWVIELASRSHDALKDQIETQNSETTKASDDPVCPHCGGTDQIFSVYRDGGSMLYHWPCGRQKKWKNPNFKRLPEGTR